MRTYSVIYNYRIHQTFHTLGNIFLVAAVIGMIFLFAPIIHQEVFYNIHKLSHKRPQKTPMGMLVERIRAEQQYQAFVEDKARELGAPNTSFSIVIPKIGAKAGVTANVYTEDERSYLEALKSGVAHAAGTVFPGMEGTIFLFAHSTDAPINFARYNAVFYLLREMLPEDDIFIFFNNKFYPYKVIERKVVESDDISWIADAQSHGQRLVLQTCWPPGTTVKRLLVIAEPQK